MPRRHVLIILVLMIAMLSVTHAEPRNRFYEENRRFHAILGLILNNYYEEVDAETLFEGAYRGMLAELDPYCQYFNQREFKSFSEDTTGKFGGLGIEISIRDGILTVVTPIAGTPAYKAGLLPGDKILAIEGESTERITLHEALNLLRGEPGASVTITVRHAGTSINEDVTIVRDIIKPAIIEYAIAYEEPLIGHIKVHSFTTEMLKQFDDAADKLKRDGIRALVLDLRGNPGGLLEAAVGLSDRFLNEGVIVTLRGRDNEYTWKAGPNDTQFGSLPVIVLVNAGSASASEIVSAALQGNERSLVVGMPTYGKGAVQSVTELDGKAALKLTTAMYYTPGNKPITRDHPVTPDVQVDMPVEDLIALRQQRMEDKIRGKEFVPFDERDNGDAAEGDPEEEALENGEKRKRVRDVQLESAIAILKLQLRAADKVPAGPVATTENAQ